MARGYAQSAYRIWNLCADRPRSSSELQRESGMSLAVIRSRICDLLKLGYLMALRQRHKAADGTLVLYAPAAKIPSPDEMRRRRNLRVNGPRSWPNASCSREQIAELNRICRCEVPRFIGRARTVRCRDRGMSRPVRDAQTFSQRGGAGSGLAMEQHLIFEP